MATRPEIIEKVKQRLDEISTFENEEVDAVSLIDNIMDESANTLRLAAPVMLLRSRNLSQVGKVTNSDDSGHLLLPYDFLRLHSFKLTAWHAPVFKAIGVDNPKYKLQRNQVTRGGVVKPVVVIRYHYDPNSITDSDGKILEYFSAPIGGSHNIDFAKYVQQAAAQDVEEILVDTLAWQCAGDVYVIQEMPQQAQVAYAKVKEIIDKLTL